MERMIKAAKGLSYDTRKTKKGYLFFALDGEKEDGNKFIWEAKERGCIGVVSEREKPENWGETAWYQVEDVRKVMAESAREFFGRPDEQLKVIGVTGTSGKSTVVGMIKHGLQAMGIKTGSIGTMGYDLGGRVIECTLNTPESVDLFGYMREMVNNGCQVCVMEVSSHGLDRKRAYGLNFEIAAFLNISHEHLDYHKNMDNYLDVKMSLFDGRNGSIPFKKIINLEEYKERIFEVKEVKMDANGSEFIIEGAGKTVVGKTGLIGRFNVDNFAVATEALYLMGYELEKIVDVLAGFEGVEGRMQKLECGQDFSVVVDYAHKYEALKKVLEALRQIVTGRLIVVFGCGGNRDRGKRKLMTQVAIEIADLVYATSDNPRYEDIEAIFADMKEGVNKSDKIVFIENRREAISKALEEARFGDCVLIAGKGHEKYQEIKGEKFAFEDRQVVVTYLTNARSINRRN